MDLTHLIIAGLTAALNVVTWILPDGSAWHAIAAGAVLALGGMSALIAGHQSATTPQLASSGAALTSGTVIQLRPEETQAQVSQPAPEQDQQGLP